MKLRQELKGNVFFTSDPHFSHKNVAGAKISNWESGYRVFDSTHEMNKAICDGINNKVGQDDTLFLAGDFYFGDKSQMQSMRNMIYCQNIIYILGNHDKEYEIKRVFGDMYDVCEFYLNGQHYFISHYAHRVWNKSHRNSIHLYGHSHDSLDKDGTEWGKSMDIGVDSAYRILGKWECFSEEEILRIMNKRQIKVLDHHK